MPGFVNYKKGALDWQPQVIKFTSCLPNCRWFSPGTPASSTTKTGRHDIVEILLKVALSKKKSKIKPSADVSTHASDSNTDVDI